MQPKPDGLVVVAQIGKTVGLKGEMKLHHKSDFIEQFKKSAKFYLDDGTFLNVSNYNNSRELITFKDFDTVEKAQTLVNKFLYSTIEDSRKNCNLGDEEFFWFDVIGLEVIENDVVLGTVVNIDEIAGINYFLITTHESLVEKGMPKSFLLPYIDKFVIKCDIQSKQIYTNGAFDILEAS